MKRRAYIFGAGVTGLSVAWKLAEAGFRVTVAEKERWIGGQAATFQRGDCRYDLGPHKIFTIMEDVMATIRDLLGDDLLTVPKVGKIYFKGKFVNFPVGPKDMLRVFSAGEMLRCLSSFLTAHARGALSRREPATYEEWVVHHFGAALYRMVVQPCTEKIWGESGTLGVELARTRIRVQSIAELIKELIFRVKPDRVVNALFFHYPRHGIGMLSDRIALRLTALGGEIRTGLVAVSLGVAGGAVSRITWSDGSSDTLAPNDVVISTIPKHDLIGCMEAAHGRDVRAALDALRERSLILLYLLLRKDSMSDYSWIFFPEKEFIFNRVFEQKKCSPSMVPEGKTLVCAEVTCRLEDPTWRAKEKRLLDVAADNLAAAGLAARADIADSFQVRLPHAYPIWDVYSRSNLQTVMEHIDGYANLYSVGRQGGFTYGGVADCMDIGFQTARFIAAHDTKKGWREVRERFHDYVVID